MNRPTGTLSSPTTPGGFDRCWPPLLIAAAGVAVYANSFSGPFVFDDVASIATNQTIRHLWPLGAVLSPPSGGLTVSGRPLLNLSLALNFAISGTSVWSYHALNLLIHVLAGLTLFGVVRRTVEKVGTGGPPVRSLGGPLALTERTDARAARPYLFAFAVALLWTVHPLQTEAVTYIVQRAESLMGLFYLLTIYCFIRGADREVGTGGSPVRSLSGLSMSTERTDARAARPYLWFGLSCLACLLGMATKENMVSAPVIALLYDRTFLSGGFRAAWQKRRSVYLGLVSTWILLIYLVWSGGGGRSGSVGFGVAVPWWAYSLTQFQAIARYVRLAVWPRPLIFEYGSFWVTHATQIVPAACLVVPLVTATIVALWRWPAWGFLGFWFFAILAPTSLVPGTTQMIVEHRMYLALAPLLAAIAGGGYAIFRQRFVLALFLFAGVCAFLTFRRNEAYRTELTLWADAAAQRPQSALAHNNLGAALAKLPGHTAEAVAEYQEALRLDPDFYEAHNNLANAWAKDPGKMNEAIEQYREALRLNPGFAEAHNDLGDAWAKIPGRLPDAIAEYREAIRLKPGYAGAHNNLGNALMEEPGGLSAAIEQYQEALRLDPGFADAHNNLGQAWAALPGRLDAAIGEFEAALRLQPDFAAAHNNLGNAWTATPGKLADATAQIKEALRLQPDYPEAHNNLGNIWANTPGRLADADAQYEEALRLNPDYAEAHFNLAIVLLNQPGRLAEAEAHLQAFLRLRPDNQAARQILSELHPAAGN